MISYFAKAISSCAQPLLPLLTSLSLQAEALQAAAVADVPDDATRRVAASVCAGARCDRDYHAKAVEMPWQKAWCRPQADYTEQRMHFAIHKGFPNMKV